MKKLERFDMLFLGGPLDGGAFAIFNPPALERSVWVKVRGVEELGMTVPARISRKPLAGYHRYYSTRDPLESGTPWVWSP